MNTGWSKMISFFFFPLLAPFISSLKFLNESIMIFLCNFDGQSVLVGKGPKRWHTFGGHTSRERLPEELYPSYLNSMTGLVSVSGHD